MNRGLAFRVSDYKSRISDKDGRKGGVVAVMHGWRDAASIARRCAIVLVVLVATTASSAFALTQIDFVSDAGDYIGGGQIFSLTPADGPITATKSGSGVNINFSGLVAGVPTNWSLTFVPIEAMPLVPGNYPSAQRFPLQSPKRPGLDISGAGRGCNTLTGKFTLYEATFDAGGNVISFGADAEQHCEGATAALHARIRFNSNVPLITSAPQSIPGLPQEVYERTLVTLDGSQSYDPDGQIVAWQWSQTSGPAVLLESPTTAIARFRAPNVPPGGADVQLRLDVADNSGNHAIDVVNVHVFDQHDRRSWLTWRSPPDDYIGQGRPLNFTADDGDATLGTLLFGVPAADVFFHGDAFNSWTLDFAAPNGAVLLPGAYLSAERFPFQSAGRPGLDVYGSGRGCNTLSGQFTVLEFDSAASPARFGARFVQSCEGFMPALRGTVLFNAIAPGNPIARITGPTYAPPGTAVTLDGTTSSSTGSTLVSFRWRQRSGLPVASSDPTLPQLTFIVPGSATTSLRFELEVTDEDGLVDVAEIIVASAQAVVDVPTLSQTILAILAATIALSGLLALRSSRVTRSRSSGRAKKRSSRS